MRAGRVTARSCVIKKRPDGEYKEKAWLIFRRKQFEVTSARLTKREKIILIKVIYLVP